MKKSFIRENLINARKNKGLTQVEISEKLEISTRQYQSLEAGTSDGRIKTWYKLKEILGVQTIDFLLKQEIEKKSDCNPTEN